MNKKWSVQVDPCISTSPINENTLVIKGLKRAQIQFIRCMLQIDPDEVGIDIKEDWGFLKKDGNLSEFSFKLAAEMEKLGF